MDSVVGGAVVGAAVLRPDLCYSEAGVAARRRGQRGVVAGPGQAGGRVPGHVAEQLHGVPLPHLEVTALRHRPHTRRHLNKLNS